MLTVTLLNRKGGVGKTSSTFHLAGTLAKINLRVLLIDNDPQSSLTNGFYGPDWTRDLDPATTIAAIYHPHSDPVPELVIRSTPVAGISIVAGSEDLTRWNLPPCDVWAESQYGLRDFLRSISSEFDVCLIDCLPNLHLPSWAALAASDAVIVPLQAEDFGAQGMFYIQTAIEGVRGSINPRLSLLGYLITMYDKRLGIHLAYESVLRSNYGTDVFTNPIPLAKDFKESVIERLPISHYKPRSAAAKAVAAVAQEMLHRATERRLVENSEVAA